MTDSLPIAITLDNGEVAVMRFILIGRGPVLPFGGYWMNNTMWGRDPTPENLAHEIGRTFDNKLTSGEEIDRPQPVSWRVIDESVIPTDRTYRAAWMDDGKKITHDMEKAKAIHADRLRAERKGLLDELDAQWMKAMGSKDEATADAVEAQRQVLRDVPADPRIAAAKTVDELKLVEMPVEEISVLDMAPVRR